jgi:hypothetical protein
MASAMADSCGASSSFLEASEVSGSTPVRVPAGSPTQIANDIFEGMCLLVVRDPELKTAPTPNSPRWELQVQGRFKRSMDHFYMGLELDRLIHVSMVLRGVSGVVLAFVRSMQEEMHSSFGSDGGTGGVYELPHIAAPHFRTIDYIVETPDGQTPPTLGTNFHGGVKQQNATKVRQ